MVNQSEKNQVSLIFFLAIQIKTRFSYFTMKKDTTSYEPIRKIFPGTICRVAIQCHCPDTGELGSFLFAGEVRDRGCRVSPVFPDCYELFQWVHRGNWQALCYDYIFKG